MSTSIPLCKLVDNKVWTRSVLIEAEVEVPLSLNFLYKCQPLPLITDPRMTVVLVNEKPTTEDISERVKTFVELPFVTSQKVTFFITDIIIIEYVTFSSVHD